MRIISLIEDTAIIEKILIHIGLGEVKPRPVRSPPDKSPEEITYDYSLFD